MLSTWTDVNIIRPMRFVRFWDEIIRSLSRDEKDGLIAWCRNICRPVLSQNLNPDILMMQPTQN
jgi:hypothetical protein